MTDRGPAPWTVGFLGPRGTFTEGAARTYGAALWQYVPFDDIPALLQAAAQGDVDDAVVPVENSIEGTVNVTLDTLVRDVDLRVVADVVLPVRHHLLVQPGTDWRQVRLVVSHPQALAQCRRWLGAHLPGVAVEAALSTAAAAARVARIGGGPGASGATGEKSAERDVAAIGNRMSAELYDLHIAAEDIQDERVNETRFFVVRRPGRLPPGRGRAGDGEDEGRVACDRDGGKAVDGEAAARVARGPWTTSVAFAFPSDGPGNLYAALGEFARRRINLTKLESRPARRALGQYIFFADLEGRADDGPVAEGLAALAGRCRFVKVLGSYPRIRG